jgi:hypothetical protein
MSRDGSNSWKSGPRVRRGARIPTEPVSTRKACGEPPPSAALTCKPLARLEFEVNGTRYVTSGVSVTLSLPAARLIDDWFMSLLHSCRRSPVHRLRGLFYGNRELFGSVLDALRTNRFYILTHPEFNAAIELRLQDILEGRVPTDLIPASV